MLEMRKDILNVVTFKRIIIGSQNQEEYFSPASCNLQNTPPSHYDRLLRTEDNCIAWKNRYTVKELKNKE